MEQNNIKPVKVMVEIASYVKKLTKLKTLTSIKEKTEKLIDFGIEEESHPLIK